MKTRDRAVSLVVLALVVVLAGCGGTGEKSDPVARDVGGTPSAAPDLQSPRVELLDPGAGPREALRLTLTAGETQRSSMRMLTSTKVTIDGEAVPEVEVPAMVLGMVVDVDEVRPDGVTVASFVYDSVRAEGTGPAAEQMEEGLKDILGVSGSMEFTSTGVFIDGDLEIPSDMDETMQTTLRSMETQLSSFSVPLPEAEVGIGAIWTVTTQTAINGIKAENVYRYELVERTGETVVLAGTIAITASEQEPDLPGLPAGSVVRLNQMAMSGTAEVEIDLRRLLPLVSSTSSSGDLEMTIEADGTTSTMLQEMAMTMELRQR